ncbi:SURF1 family cytochrome oxidase biogenesis protein [Kineococcus sp. SYSU DK003]|uniref:SURF1 family cytochrome oxidase biogenesis protein n=1 Tax=Kineococcus sp. SYSU DK003 TaxID=3383124 RepID=UPI003D7C83A5
MNVLRLLREPRWIRGLAVAVLVALVCCVLGRWQWHRREDRLAANGPLVQNYDAAPVEVTSVLPAGAELADEDVWTAVRVSGTYDTDATVLVRNRPRDEQTGYDVLVPLVLGDGTALLVDRGWLPAGADAERPDSVPAPPAGQVSVVAHLRQWEDARRGTVPPGQVGSIAAGAVGEATAAAGAPELLGGYGVLVSEDPAAAQAPAKAVEPTVDEGPHLAYTVQWFGFALTALIVWVVAGRRELQARAEAAPAQGAAEPSNGGTEAADAVAPSGVAGPATPPAPAARSTRSARGARRRGGLDEAAEDAELDAIDHR